MDDVSDTTPAQSIIIKLCNACKIGRNVSMGTNN